MQRAKQHPTHQRCTQDLTGGGLNLRPSESDCSAQAVRAKLFLHELLAWALERRLQNALWAALGVAQAQLRPLDPPFRFLQVSSAQNSATGQL